MTFGFRCNCRTLGCPRLRWFSSVRARFVLLGKGGDGDCPPKVGRRLSGRTRGFRGTTHPTFFGMTRLAVPPRPDPGAPAAIGTVNGPASGLPAFLCASTSSRS